MSGAAMAPAERYWVLAHAVDLRMEGSSSCGNVWKQNIEWKETLRPGRLSLTCLASPQAFGGTSR